MNERYAAVVRRHSVIDPEREPAAAVGHAFAMWVAEYHAVSAAFADGDETALLAELGDCCWALTGLCIALDAPWPEMAQASYGLVPECEWLAGLADGVQHWYEEGPEAAQGDALEAALAGALAWIQVTAQGEGWTIEDVLAANEARLRSG